MSVRSYASCATAHNKVRDDCAFRTSTLESLRDRHAEEGARRRSTIVDRFSRNYIYSRPVLPEVEGRQLLYELRYLRNKPQFGLVLLREALKRS